MRSMRSFLRVIPSRRGRTISNVSDADRVTFGLDHPRLTLTLQVADEQQVVRVGGDEEGTEGVFVEVEGTDAAYIVGRDFFEALDQNTDHFRSKRLVADFVPREVQRFSVDCWVNGDAHRST